MIGLCRALVVLFCVFLPIQLFSQSLEVKNQNSDVEATRDKFRSLETFGPHKIN